MKKLKKKKKVKKAKKAKEPRKEEVKRTSGGRYDKGVCGNPKGRPAGSKNKYSVAELEQAIKTVEEKKHKTFLEAWIEAAWGNATDMANVANFMMPKLRAIEQITYAADSMSDEEAEDIRKEKKEQMIAMLKRFRGG